MRKFSLHEYAPETIDYYVRQIPFFDELASEEPAQFALLLQHTFIMELEAGEVLMEKDAIDNVFYALVHGQLAIFQQRRPGDTAIGELFPGQILGALSVINHEPRTATVVVSSVEGATVLVTDYAVFGEIDDFSRVSLTTKLRMFRDVAGNIHRTLSAYETAAPDEQLSQELSTLTGFYGEKDSMEELVYLTEFATALTWLLGRWNEKITPVVSLFDEKIIERRMAKLLNIELRH